MVQNSDFVEIDYQFFFQQSFDLFIITNNHGRILRINTQWQKTLGYSQEEMEGKLFINFVHPDDVTETIKKLKEIIKTTSDEGFVNRYRSKNGDYKYIEWKITVAGGQIYSSARDITFRKMLESEKEHFLRFFTLSKDLMVIADHTGKTLRVNPMVKEMLGYTPEEFLSSPYQSFAAPEYRAEQQKAVEKLLATGEVLNHHSRIYRKDGSIADILWHLIYISEYQTIYAAGRDVTELRQAEKKIKESENRFRSLFENMNSGFVLAEIIYDKKGKAADYRILEVNQALTTLTRFKAEELLGKRILEFDPDFNQEMIKLFAKVAETGVPAYKVFYYPSIDKYFSVQSYSPKPGQVASVFDDISEQTNAAKLINKKNAELEKSNAEKDKFLSIIAHDLRSPFQGFLGVLDMLNDETDSLTPAEIKERLGVLRESGKKLYSLIDNLLLWSSFQRGKIPFAPVKVRPGGCISTAVDSFYTVLAMKELTLVREIQEDIYIHADKMMMNTVLRNLLSNAVKFSYRRGKIFVSVKEKRGFAEITVRDEGVGIPPENLPRLFKIGEKVSTRGTENEPSSGLGLILCSEFTETNGGCLSVESTVGKGSAFTLRFPLLN